MRSNAASLFLFLGLLPAFPAMAEPTEAEYNRPFCHSVGGQTETRHYYIYAGGRSHISVDCETATHVYEGGLDKRASLDSVQQALFAAHLTGKLPAVVIYDSDGKEGQYEYRIRIAAELARVRYEIYNWEDSD